MSYQMYSWKIHVRNKKEECVMKHCIRCVLALTMLVCLFPTGVAIAGEQPIKLVGATMLPQEHIYYRTLVKFQELVKTYYPGPLEIELHHSGTLGSEQENFQYLLQGLSLDFSIISPAFMTTADKTAALMEAPFIFSGRDHLEKCLEQGVFDPIAERIRQQGVRFIGYGGGGVRNLILNQPVATMEDLPKIRMRVQNSPLHQKVFSVIGLQAIPYDYQKVYDAIKAGVLDGLENEPAGMQQMKFYEVAPYYILTQHTISIRLLCFNEARFKTLPPALQEAILKAGQETAKFHRATEFAEGKGILDKLVQEGKLTVLEFDNTEMRKRVLPVLEDYVKEIGAEPIFQAMKAVQ